jgi:hypothetical protein
MNAAAAATQPLKSAYGSQQDSAKAPLTDVSTLAVQVKELQQQINELKAQVRAMQLPSIVSAGTATFLMGAVQDNVTNARVKLSADVAARLGDDYIVLLTNRYPTGGYPFFVPYWKRAKEGFDITLIDVNLPPNSTSTYLYNKNRTFLIDWIVVKK